MGTKAQVKTKSPEITNTSSLTNIGDKKLQEGQDKGKPKAITSKGKNTDKPLEPSILPTTITEVKDIAQRGRSHSPKPTNITKLDSKKQSPRLSRDEVQNSLRLPVPCDKRKASPSPNSGQEKTKNVQNADKSPVREPISVPLLAGGDDKKTKLSQKAKSTQDDKKSKLSQISESTQETQTKTVGSKIAQIKDKTPQKNRSPHPAIRVQSAKLVQLNKNSSPKIDNPLKPETRSETHKVQTKSNLLNQKQNKLM